MTPQEIVYRDPRKLRPYERNARVHPPEQIEQIKASIREFGWGRPVLLRDDDKTIGAGHGATTAAVEMLEAGEKLPTPDGVSIPTITLKGLSEAQWRGLVIADNKIGLASSWDENLLRLELSELKAGGLDLSLTGFQPLELTNLFLDRADGATNADEEWSGMPEFDQQDKTAYRSIALHFKDQAAVDKFAAMVKQEITAKTRYLWFPKIVIETYADKRYTISEKTKAPAPEPAAEDEAV